MLDVSTNEYAAAFCLYSTEAETRNTRISHWSYLTMLALAMFLPFRGWASSSVRKYVPTWDDRCPFPWWSPCLSCPPSPSDKNGHWWM